MNTDKIIKELTFKAVRSSGPGGQHVNKTSSKVELIFNIANSEAISEIEKERLQKNLRSRITNDGDLILSCGETRSQHRNKAIIIDKIIELLKEGLKEKKPRKKTKPSNKAIEKRLSIKKKTALKKVNRKRPPIDQ